MGQGVPLAVLYRQKFDILYNFWYEAIFCTSSLLVGWWGLESIYVPIMRDIARQQLPSNQTSPIDDTSPIT